MPEYVEKKAIRDALYDADAITMEGVKILNQFQAVDVTSVVHGLWVEWYPPKHMILTGEEMLYRCSSCDAKYSDVEGFRFCPNCGAKMDLEG